MARTLSSSVVRKRKKFKGQWVSVEYWTYRRSDGLEITHETLVDDDTSIVLALDEKKNTVFLLREFRDPLNAFSWRLPWGYVEKKEFALSAAKRELAEEAGLRARAWKKIFSRKPEGKNHNRVHAYLATRLEKTRQNLEVAEQIRVIKKSLFDAAAMALDGRINEPMVSMLILRVAHLNNIVGLNGQKIASNKPARSGRA